MKKFLSIVLIMVAMQVFVRANPITAINITLPANPDALTGNWGTVTSVFTISARSQSANGRVDPSVAESKILVTIKQNGNKVCGAYTSKNAPSAGFNAPGKEWDGANAAALLGKGCALPPGDYVLSVQFFRNVAAGPIPLSDEKTQPFTIRGNDQQSYQPPQPISPADGTSFSAADIKKPITFSWKTNGAAPGTTYGIKIVEVRNPQSPIEAIKANTPIITKDEIKGGSYTANPNPAFLSGNKFAWVVTSFDGSGKQTGQSAPQTFSASACNVNLSLKLVSADCISSTKDIIVYKICVVAIYSSPVYKLTYANNGSGFKAYAPSNTPFYGISNISPAMQVQNSGATTSVSYCMDVNVPPGQTTIELGLQGDDADPGPLTCQPDAGLEIKLPQCAPTCSCGTWGALVIPAAAGNKSYKCGSELRWSCNQPFNFTTTYQCNGDPRLCRPSTTWEVVQNGNVLGSGSGTANLAGSFTPTANGTYTINLSAVCGGLKCPVCSYTVTVANCVTCNCGKWASLIVNKTLRYECGSKGVPWKCGQQISFTNTYSCSSTGGNCAAKTSYTVEKDGASIQTNTGTNTIAGAFTPTTNGTYTITLYSTCNELKCPPCTYTFVVSDCVTCDCGTWGPFSIPRASGVAIDYKCGATIQGAIGTPLNFTSSYQCSPSDKTCQPVTFWTVKLNGNSAATGNGVGGSINGAFTPTTAGTYTITLNGSCNGKRCEPCTIYVQVPPAPCPQLCNGGFEQIINGQASSSYVQTDQSNVPCWNTTATDHLIEIWHTGFNGVQSQSGTYFAEVNGTSTAALFQTFTPASSKNIVISFAHRGRYSGHDVMQVLLIHGSTTVILGTYSDTDSGWRLYSTPATPVTGGTTYTIKFQSISTNDGKGPPDGGNFLDSVSISCVDVLPNTNK